MKKLILTTLASVVTAASMSAQSPSGANIVATPQVLSVAPGGTFNVDFSLSGTTPPATSNAYDMYLVTSSANTNLFTLTSSTPTSPFNALGPSLGAGDTLNVAAASGFVRNSLDLG